MHALSTTEAMRNHPDLFRGTKFRGPSFVDPRERRLAAPGSETAAYRVAAGAEHTNAPPIDRDSGALNAAEGTISPSTTRTSFLLSALFTSGDWTNEEDDWYGASSILLTLAGTPFGTSMLFQGEQIASISLMITDPRYGTSWDDYSEENERAREARHQSWLREQFGTWRRPFAWGSILCAFDSKSGFSSIELRYGDRWTRSPALSV